MIIAGLSLVLAGGLYLARHREPYIGTVYLLGPAETCGHRCGAPGGASHLWIIRAISRTPYFWLLISVYAICGFKEFFVYTHFVGFAPDLGRVRARVLNSQRVDTRLADRAPASDEDLKLVGLVKMRPRH